MDFVRNNTKCNADETICTCVKLNDFRLTQNGSQDMDAATFIEALLPTEMDPDPLKRIGLPVMVTLDSHGYPVAEWDPNLQVLFDMPITVPTQNNVLENPDDSIHPGVIAGIVVGVVCIAGIVGTVVFHFEREQVADSTLVLICQLLFLSCPAETACPT